MRTAIAWVDKLDTNRSSEAEYKDASEFLVEGYRRMHALDEENIMIMKKRILGWRFYVI